MTAIAGLWNFDGRPDAGAGCGRMLAAQQLYGPDDERLWAEGPVALGRRLYRLLPEDRFDRQPVRSADGRLTLVADLRLDNRDEIALALGIAAELAGMADSDLLLSALERWGEGALDRVAGDFAFALWDARERRLLLARDPLGQRPLHYHRGSGFFAFATMPKGLHALSDVPYGPDEQAVAEFVALLPPDPSRSFFESIARVPAGSLVRVRGGEVEVRKYWNPAPPEGRPAKRDWAEGLRHHLDQATRARLRGAEGAVGSQLSAGYDSAAVTATAARLLAPEGKRVVAFTAAPRAGYDGPIPRGRIGDEGVLAAATAAMYPNVEHVLVRSDGTSPFEPLDRMFFLFDRPILNPCNFTWIGGIAAAARERGLPILLTGQMGNMGLSYSGLEGLAELLQQGRLLKLARVAASLVRNRQIGWRTALSHSLGPFSPGWLWQRVHRLRGQKPDLLHYTALHPERLTDLDLKKIARERGVDFAYRPRRNGVEARLWRLSREDIGLTNKGLLAGWGVDQRDPTADRRLLEYCLAAPPEAFLAGGRTRALAQDALADRVPTAVLGESRKGYQGADWHESFAAGRGDIAAELARLGACEPARRALDVARLQRLAEDWPDGRWDRDDVIAAHRLALGRGIAVGHFLRRASGANR